MSHQNEIETKPKSRALSREEALKNLEWSSSYTRLPAVLELFDLVDKGEWLRILGKEWPSCDNHWESQKSLRAKMGIVGPLRPMMTPEENAAYDKLPNEVTIYRGGEGLRGWKGSSWSLDWEIANLFPILDRYKAIVPMVWTATVKKNRILALKLDRDESEVITFSAKPIDFNHVDKARAHLTNARRRREDEERREEIREWLREFRSKYQSNPTPAEYATMARSIRRRGRQRLDGPSLDDGRLSTYNLGVSQ